MTRAIGCLVVALAIAACEADPFAPALDERFVVQAYLYAGEPVRDVRVTATLPLGAPDSVAPPINDAQVALYRNGQRFELTATPGDSGFYHYPGSDLAVEPGDVFDLEVTARGVTATARTTVPPRPQGVSVTPEELRVDGFWATEPVVVRWSNPEREWYFITHRNVEADPQPIFEGTVFIRPGLIVSEPTVTDSAVIPVFSMRHYGAYEVNVYRVNEEYEQLYTARKQDTRDLNEPPTNIVNGIGIFTAFSGRSGTFSLPR